MSPACRTCERCRLASCWPAAGCSAAALALACAATVCRGSTAGRRPVCNSTHGWLHREVACTACARTKVRNQDERMTSTPTGAHRAMRRRAAAHDDPGRMPSI